MYSEELNFLFSVLIRDVLACFVQAFQGRAFTCVQHISGSFLLFGSEDVRKGLSRTDKARNNLLTKAHEEPASIRKAAA